MSSTQNCSWHLTSAIEVFGIYGLKNVAPLRLFPNNSLRLDRDGHG